MLGSGKWKPQEDGSYFIDCDPTGIEYLFDYLRTGKTNSMKDLNYALKVKLQDHFDYFMIPLPTSVSWPTPAQKPPNDPGDLKRVYSLLEISRPGKPRGQSDFWSSDYCSPIFILDGKTIKIDDRLKTFQAWVLGKDPNRKSFSVRIKHRINHLLSALNHNLCIGYTIPDTTSRFNTIGNNPTARSYLLYSFWPHDGKVTQSERNNTLLDYVPDMMKIIRENGNYFTVHVFLDKNERTISFGVNDKFYGIAYKIADDIDIDMTPLYPSIYVGCADADTKVESITLLE